MNLRRGVTLAVRNFVGRRLADSQEEWFLACLEAQHAAPDTNPAVGTYWEFGVAGGGSAWNFAQAATRFCRRYGTDPARFHIVGFDSFAGLPASEMPQDANPYWQPGLMRHPQAEVSARLKDWPGKLTLIEGFYEDSLGDTLRDELPSPSVVTVDCDLYSSTMTALRWAAPALESGTFLLFDDAWSFHGHPDFGELAAIRDLQAEGRGYFTRYDRFGWAGNSYVYARPEWGHQR